MVALDEFNMNIKEVRESYDGFLFEIAVGQHVVDTIDELKRMI
jgi:adenylate kinase